ncbi:hypothetical protein FZEAL_6969 [Fusarium zealandicum]|uniref:BZIP domain-containing protein n=1 Tax=Fusarium zealandicum TaxID=1053134 RepID=A0A8H4UHF8_9HYPO|nr:hypothetical protein FZEAL_6969 [Fusarium zealandicum]
MDRGASKVAKGKAPAKRNTEARREQNRLASRNYREKRKQKLALLNQILEPSDVAEIANVTENADIDSLQNQVGSSDGVSLGSQALPISGVPPVDPLLPVDSTINQDVANVGSAQPFSFDSTLGHLSHQYIPPSNAPPSQPSYPDSLSLPFALLDDPFVPADMNLWTAEAVGPSQNLLQHTDDISMNDYVNPGFVQEILDDSPESTGLGGQSGPHTPLDDTTFHKVLDGVGALSMSQKRSLLRRLQEETQDTTPSRPRQPTRAQIEAIKFSKAIHHAANANPSPLPTQYITEASIFGAMFANCYVLGMGGVEEILVEEGCSVFSVTPDEGHAQSQLSLVRPRFGNVKADLRPTDLQLTFGHHPYIDVIPFKSFRENIIKALLHDPPLIDEGILCHDLLAGGFICWGSGRNPLGMSAAVPWDARSWEPSVWFMLKYRQLAGGWDDELWKSARWWHGVRGERIQMAPTMGSVNGAFGNAARR